jgi:hypothetical protein
VREVVVSAGLLTGEAFDALVGPEAVCRLGTPVRGPMRGG